MEILITSIIVGLIALIVGYYIGTLKTKNTLGKEVSELNVKHEVLLQERVDNTSTINELNESVKQLVSEKHQLEIERTQDRAAIENANEKLEEHKQEVSNLREQFAKDFEILANKILQEKSKTFTEQNKVNMETILNPLQDKIKTFEDKVDKTHKESIDYHAALREQIVGLSKLNEQMSKEAINLTKALKGDSKAQGDWGETQLELLLEKANLLKEVHFTTQGGYRDEHNRLKKPDFVINLPDSRHLIIDSKVSLTAYEAFVSAENESIKQANLKKHIESIRKHFKELGEKKYESLYEINTPDYVLMFVPIEPALMLALSEVQNLYLEALDKNVVLVSTSTLLATLSTVSSMWRQENQKRNVLEIAEQAGRLYDQFVNLTDDLIKVGNQLKTVQGTYDSSMKKLTGRGNLVRRVEIIKELGAKTTKKMNQNLLSRAQESEES